MIKITTLLAILCASISPFSIGAVESTTSQEDILVTIRTTKDLLPKVALPLPYEGDSLEVIYERCALKALYDNGFFKNGLAYLEFLLKEFRAVNAGEEKISQIEKNISEKLESLNIAGFTDWPLSAYSILLQVRAASPLEKLLEDNLWIQETHGFSLDVAKEKYHAIRNIIAKDLGDILSKEFHGLYKVNGMNPSAKSEVFTQEKKDQIIAGLEQCARNLINALKNFDFILED